MSESVPVSGSEEDVTETSRGQIAHSIQKIGSKANALLANKKSVSMSRIFVPKKEGNAIGPSTSGPQSSSHYPSTVHKSKTTNSLPQQNSLVFGSYPTFQWNDYDKRLEASNKKLTPTRSLRVSKRAMYEEVTSSTPIPEEDNSKDEEEEGKKNKSNPGSSSSYTEEYGEESTISRSPKPKKKSKHSAVGVLQRNNSRDRITKDPKEDLTDMDWRSMGVLVFNLPNDDLYIKRVQLPLRTYLPEDVFTRDDKITIPYIVEWVKIVRGEHKVVEHKYESYGNKIRPLGTSSSDIPTYHEKIVRFDNLEDASNTTEEILNNANYVDPYPQSSIDLQHSKNIYDPKLMRDFRQDVFAAFPVTTDKDLNPLVLKKPDLNLEKLPECHLLIESIKIDTSVVSEYLFLDFSLHNIAKSTKISEDFHCIYDTNLKQQIYLGNKTKPVFPVSSNHVSDIYLIVRVSRIAKSYNEKDYKMYIKGTLSSSINSTSSPSKVEQPKFEAIDLNKEEYVTLPFLWAAIPLFDAEGKFLGAVKNPVSKDNIKNSPKEEDPAMQIPSRSFHTELKVIKPTSSVSDDEIYSSLQKDTEMKKHKPFSGRLSVELKKLPSEFKNRRLNPSLSLVKSSEASVKENATIPQYQEIQEFYAEGEDEHAPNLSYVNNLYVHLRSASLKNTEALQVKIQVKKTDGSKDVEKTLYSKYKNEFADTQWSQIYYNKSPDLNDEIKIRLPLELNNNYHVLFTFYDVSLKRGNKVHYPLGYAVMVVYDDNKIISDGIHNLQVSKSHNSSDFPETGYIKNSRWSKHSKIQVYTRLVSSIYSQDPTVNRYLINYTKEKEVVDSIQKLIAHCVNSKLEILKFLHVILNTLFAVLCGNNERASTEAFRGIVALLKLFDNSITQKWLNFYAVYLFDNVKSEKLVFEQICHYFVEIESAVLEGFKSYWFLFNILTKSMALLLDDSEKLNSKKRYDKFSITFKANLLVMLPRLLGIAAESTLGYDVAVSFPLFLVSLFPMLPPSQVFKMIFTFISNTGNYESTKIVKFTLLNIIANYQHYIPLNFCMDVDVETIDFYNVDIPQVFWSRHFLSGLLLNEIAESIQGNSTFRDQGITMFRNLLRKHCFDVRYQHSEVKKQLMGVYFPFILITSQNYASIKEFAESELIKWLHCFLCILKHIKPSILKWWWSKDTQRNTENFLDLCSLSLTLYKDANNSVEANFIILDALHSFVNHFSELLEKEEHPWQSKIFKIILQLLSSKSELFICSVYSALNEFIFKLKRTLFLFKASTFCQDLSEQIIRHCNVVNTCVRERARKTLFLFVKANFIVKNNISRTSIQSILSVSRVVGTEMTQTFTLLHKTLSSIRSFYNSIDDLSLKDKFVGELEELLARLTEITKQNRRLAQSWIDEEMTADIYVQIANESLDSPDLRLTWLDSLALFHVQNGNIEEAAQCKVHIAYLIAQYVQLINPKQLPKELRGKSEIWQKVAPSVLSELPLATHLKEEDEARFQSDLWNLQGVVKVLNEVVTLLERSRRYELCLEVLHLLAAIYKRDRSYASLKVWAQRYAQICDNLVNVTREGKEVFSRYYRVTLYGKKYLEDTHKTVYIYKKKFKYTIGDIAQTLNRTFSHKFNLPKEDIINLGNKEVSVETLDPNKIHYQIVSVLPYLPDIDERTTPFEQNFNLAQFISEIPFNKNGGKIEEDDPSKLMKRKTIFTLKRAFPYITNRIEVGSSEDIILSPEECAVESLQQRISQFRTEVFSSPPRKNNLQALLTGTLATTVNVGPMKFCEVFLTTNEYDAANQHKLREAMAELLLLSEYGVKVNKGIIGPEQLPFQGMLENKLVEFMKIFKEKYGQGLQWHTLQQDLEERARVAKLQNEELDRKLGSSASKDQIPYSPTQSHH